MNLRLLATGCAAALLLGASPAGATQVQIDPAYNTVKIGGTATVTCTGCAQETGGNLAAIAAQTVGLSTAALQTSLNTAVAALFKAGQLAGVQGLDAATVASLTNPLPTAGQAAVSAVTGTTSAATVTNTSTQVLAAASRQFLAVDNESATASIACRFGGTAALNTAGSWTIPPGATRTWLNYPVPAEALNCISSVASSPATVEVH